MAVSPTAITLRSVNSETGVGPRGSRDRPDDRRSQILRHAATLFARQGYGATTVRQIADAAHMLSGSLYHHFPSKEAMLLDIMEDVIADALLRHRTALAKTTDPVVALRGLALGTLRTVAAKPDAAVVALGEGRRLARTERFVWLSERTADTFAMWTDVLRGGVRARALRADLQPETTAYLLQTTLWSMAQWLRAGHHFDPEPAADTVVDLFLRGIATPGAYESRDLDTWLGRPGVTLPTVGVLPDVVPPIVTRDVSSGSDARDRIVNAAGALFAQQGYAVTTTRQIAELAEVPVGSLAHHIGTKERLLASMLVGFYDELRCGFEADRVRASGPVERVEAFIARTVHMLGEHGVASVILLNEQTLEGDSRRELKALFGYVARVWSYAIEDGMQAGVFRAELSPWYVHRVVRSAISTSSAIYQGMGVSDVPGLYQEIVMAGIGAR
jgi:AcrR family transcriptional regulator